MLNSQVVTLGALGKQMCQGEFESLKAIHAVSPGFAPEAYAWGRYTQECPETYFLLVEFRDVGRQVCALRSFVVWISIKRQEYALAFLSVLPLTPSRRCLKAFSFCLSSKWGTFCSPHSVLFLGLITKQPASPTKLAADLATLHKESVSPTGKFGFHMATCHAKIAQAVDTWEDSWCTLYSRYLRHVIDLARPILQWPEFDVVCKLTLEKVVPRLLVPLQSEGRVLKPCLVHGDCWDGKWWLPFKTTIFDLIISRQYCSGPENRGRICVRCVLLLWS